VPPRSNSTATSSASNQPLVVSVISAPSPPSVIVAGDAGPSVTDIASPSSSVIVPVPVSVAVTVSVVPDTVRPTVNVSSPSTRASSVVATVNVSVSPAVPAKARAAVFSV